MTKKELSQLYWFNREVERDKERLAELESAVQPGAAGSAPALQAGGNEFESLALRH